MKTSLVSLVAGAIGALCLGPTYADQFTWTYEGSVIGLNTVDGGHGTLTTGTTPVTGLGGATGYLVTNFTGQWNGLQINFLPPDSFAENSNVLYNDFSGPNGLLLDPGGIAFELSNGVLMSLIGCGDNCVLPSLVFGKYSAVSAFSTGAGPVPFATSQGTFEISPVAVPGPIVGAGVPGLIFAGAGLLGWWRRKQKAEAAA